MINNNRLTIFGRTDAHPKFFILSISSSCTMPRTILVFFKCFNATDIMASFIKARCSWSLSKAESMLSQAWKNDKKIIQCVWKKTNVLVSQTKLNLPSRHKTSSKCWGLMVTEVGFKFRGRSSNPIVCQITDKVLGYIV